MRAASGLQSVDELILWGLLGATLRTKDAEPVLLATPYWMLKHLGLETGGSQYTELRESLLRLAFTSYQNDGFYNPETQEREYAAFQFLSILLPTVGGVGETVDNDRCWRIEWNPAFFRSCRASGGNLLFDLELFRTLTPASRRLFLKLKDRFWRSKRVFMNVEDLTVNGLGFAANRPLRKRKYDLTNCIRELLDVQVLTLGRGQNDVKNLFMKRGKGSYVVVFHEGEYFRQPTSERIQRLRRRPSSAIDISAAVASRELRISLKKGENQRKTQIGEFGAMTNPVVERHSSGEGVQLAQVAVLGFDGVGEAADVKAIVLFVSRNALGHFVRSSLPTGCPKDHERLAVKLLNAESWKIGWMDQMAVLE